MYFATEASEISMPNFRSSLRIRGAPQMRFTAHGSNELTSFLRNLRPSWSTVTNLPCPIALESPTVPTDDGFGFNDDQGGTPSRPTIETAKPKTTDRSD